MSQDNRPSTSRPDLSFITINYNGIEDTTQLIESLLAHVSSLKWEIIVVDNGSKEDEAIKLKEKFADSPQVKVIEAGSNLGFAAGNNKGIKKARGRAMMLINNDTYVTDDHFSELYHRLMDDDTIGAVCPKLRFDEEPKLIQYAGFTPLTSITLRNQGIGCGEHDNGQHDTPSSTAFAHGAAVMFKWETLQRAGMMSEDYFLYYEEMDWSEHIRRAGLQIWYDPAQTVFHKESHTIGQQSVTRTYYMSRNRLIFARRNRRWPLRWCCYLYLYILGFVRDIPRHLLHRRPDLAVATLKGLAAFPFTKTSRQ
ncbi:MAG: glycosyltransferase family 2 protein [Bacteroidaceae bacterium]|nr:glycosyltransferase family 2 protein [Bacteroidaceae bacterium]